MALSVYDKRYLPQEQQDEIQRLTSAWEQTPSEEQKLQIHQQVEDIRTSFGGYTGGEEGSQFNVKDPNTFEQNGIISSVIDQGPEAGFADQDQFSLSPIMSQFKDLMQRPAPTFDEIMGSEYFKGLEASVMERAGKTAKTVEQSIVDELVGRGVLDSSMTGDRISEAVSKVFASAQTDLLNMVPGLQKNQIELNQDQISNVLSYADLAMKEFDYRVEMTDKEISRAIERTNMSGSVSNEDAIILGVQPGTPSMEAQERASEMQDYLEKQRINLSFAQQEIDYRRTSSLKEAEAKARLTGDYKAPGKDPWAIEPDGGEPLATKEDYDNVKKHTNDFNSVVASESYESMSPQSKADMIDRRMAMLIEMAESGDISEFALREIIANIRLTMAYKTDYVAYTERLATYESFYPGNQLLGNE